MFVVKLKAIMHLDFCSFQFDRTYFGLMKQFLNILIFLLSVSKAKKASVYSSTTPAMNITEFNQTSAPNSTIPLSNSSIFESPGRQSYYGSAVVCSGHGTFVCTCNPGFTGSNCETEIDFCNEEIKQLGSPTVRVSAVCAPYGDCVSTPAGATCKCQAGFTGQFCQTELPSQVWTSNRCALYDTAEIKLRNINVGCPNGQHCIPDNMICVVMGSCQVPTGWCLPMVDVKKYFDALLKY